MHLRLATPLILAALFAACAPVDQDPGLIVTQKQNIAYAAGPFGTAIGDTIADKTLYGYKDDASDWGVVRLSDFYDPKGSKHTVMALNVSARWCSVCQAEAATQEEYCSSLKDRGLVCYTAIFEGAATSKTPAKPATRDDVDYWRDRFHLPGVVVQDAALAWGEFFDKAAAPLNMVIDLTTMKIVYLAVGYNPTAQEEAVNALLKPE